MIITDGEQTIEVEMRYYKGSYNSPDNAEDILNDGSLVFDGEKYRTTERTNLNRIIEYIED